MWIYICWLLCAVQLWVAAWSWCHHVLVMGLAVGLARQWLVPCRSWQQSAGVGQGSLGVDRPMERWF